MTWTVNSVFNSWLILEMLQEQGKLCGGDENIDPFVKEYVSIIIVTCQAMEYQC